VGTVTAGGLVPNVPAPVGIEIGAIVDEGADVPVVELAVGLVELPQAAAANAIDAVSATAEIRVQRMAPGPFLVMARQTTRWTAFLVDTGAGAPAVGPAVDPASATGKKAGVVIQNAAHLVACARRDT